MDERIPSNCERTLAELGFCVIKLPMEKRLSPAVASHTDMLFFRHNNTLITSQIYFREHSDLFEKIRSCLSLDIILADEAPGKDYPYDRIFNALVIGDKLFAKSEYLSGEIIKYSKDRGLKIIPVNQGYPACVTLGAPGIAITSDAGMARTLKDEKVNVMLIPDSEIILLPPYKFGFIGGCAGVLHSTVYFIGNLLSHPYGKRIEERLAKAGYSCVSLDPESDSLFDMGGIFFFENPPKNTAVSGKNISPKISKSV